MRHLGILGSTRGTSMLPIIHAIEKKQLAAKINIVISNKKDALILERAREHQINTCLMGPEQMSEVLIAHKVDLVVLIGYMKILSSTFIEQWRNKIINVHPSLLPAFAGGMDKQVHQAVLNSGAQETGCTVHYVTEEVDAGPVILQKKCHVAPGDTVDTLKARVQLLEGKALVEALQMI